MSKQYWIGGFYIDLSRNQITQNQKTQNLAPKALAVLTYLAQNHGKVVSHDDLLAVVWPDTVVSPNTLQRSIAQLRKALGDDGRGQIFIKTHAKQGYSLECDVRWKDQDDAEQINNLPDHAIGQTQSSGINSEADSTHSASSSIKLIAILAVISLLVFLGIKHFTPAPTSTWSFDTLRSLTATDDKEFDATYSPDGKYIIFHRYLDKQCVNKIWAKHIETQQEIQLTEDWGAYGSHDFSPDGKQMVFFATEACEEPMLQKKCYDLVTLDFEQALQAPQQPNILLQCKQSKAAKPKWISENNIVMLQLHSKRFKLINYSIRDNNSTDLYNPIEGGLIDYAYSAQQEMFAVSRIKNDGQQYIEMLKPDGSLLSSNLIKRPPEIAQHRYIQPNFDPINDQLIFSTGRQLFSLTYEGQVTKINLPFADRVGQPVFHPEGNRLLMIKGPYDSDMVLMTVDQLSNPSTGNQTYQPFQRSNLGEDYAMFQPGGELIAFWSERSGEQQLWISGDSGTQQLTNLPTDTFIRGIDWAKDGQSLMVNANGELIQVQLDGQQQTITPAHAVLQLFQWDSEANSALIRILRNGISQTVEFDLIHKTIKEVTDLNINWVLKSENGQLIFKDHLDQFWRPGAIEPQHIKELDLQGNRSQTFVMHNNTIYAINNENQLWSYELSSETFSVLGTARQDVDYLTDVRASHLLMTIQVAAKKEVVELTVDE